MGRRANYEPSKQEGLKKGVPQGGRGRFSAGTTASCPCQAAVEANHKRTRNERIRSGEQEAEGSRLDDRIRDYRPDRHRLAVSAVR